MWTGGGEGEPERDLDGPLVREFPLRRVLPWEGDFDRDLEPDLDFDFDPDFDLDGPLFFNGRGMTEMATFFDF